MGGALDMAEDEDVGAVLLGVAEDVLGHVVVGVASQ